MKAARAFVAKTGGKPTAQKALDRVVKTLRVTEEKLGAASADAASNARVGDSAVTSAFVTFESEAAKERCAAAYKAGRGEAEGGAANFNPPPGLQSTHQVFHHKV